MELRFQQPADWQWAEMTTREGWKLRTGSLARHEKPVANLIIGPGMREFTEKYFETIQDFSARGYNVYFINWLGQGGSQSNLPGRFHRTAKLFGFGNDAQSLIDFTTNCVPDNARKVYMGHSTGGLIGLLAMVHSPRIFAATVMLAPFLGFYDKRANLLHATLNFFNLSAKHLERYVPFGKDWLKRTDPKSNLKPGDYSGDPVRMHLGDEWTAANPNLRTGDLTLGGFQESWNAISALEKPGIAEAIRIPTMLVTGGLEKIVSNAHIFNMASRIPGAIHTHFSASHHETLMETNEIRTPVLNHADGFFRSRLG